MKLKEFGEANEVGPIPFLQIPLRLQSGGIDCTDRTAAEAIEAVETAKLDRTTIQKWKVLLQVKDSVEKTEGFGSDLVIIDDLTYMVIGQREVNLFFHLVNHLYERSSIILTSNKSPNQSK